MISVGNSTMTITKLILLLTTGIVVVTAECQKDDAPINSCCCLGFNTTAFNKRKSGVYTMMNFCGVKCYDAEVYCDTSNGGGGWLVVQRRKDGSVDFNRGWGEYEDGFGKLTGEFWYGLRALHCLTGQGGWEMRMDIKLANGTNIFLQYEQFKVASAKDKYKLTVGGFQGTTTDPVAFHNGTYFTTRDSDNDKWNGNCAVGDPARPNGGWWHKWCWHININNFYNNKYYGIYINGEWLHKLPPFIEMKIRPHNCNI